MVGVAAVSSPVLLVDVLVVEACEVVVCWAGEGRGSKSVSGTGDTIRAISMTAWEASAGISLGAAKHNRGHVHHVHRLH